MTYPQNPGLPPGELLQALLNESQQLRLDVKDRERRQRNLMMLITAAVAAALVLIVAVVVLLVQGRQRGNDTRALVRANSATSHQIADCTTAGGKCYQESQKRTADILRQFLESDLAIQICADRTTTEQALRECVQDKLMQADPDSPPLDPPGDPGDPGAGD